LEELRDFEELKELGELFKYDLRTGGIEGI
jgi:hypothetical protein